MTRKVDFPDMVTPMSDLRSEHMPGIWYPVRPDEVRTMVSDPARGAVCDEPVVEDRAPSYIRKEGIHLIDVQHLFG